MKKRQSYRLSDRPKSTRQVNKFFRERGLPYKLINGGGYFYFVGSGPYVDSIYVYRVSELTFGEWLREVTR